MKLSRQFIAATREMCSLYDFVQAPYLRKTLEIADLKKAELSVCGLGFYRFWCNGVELTRGHMSPYISNPDDVMDYDVYDLTEALTNGKNVLGFQLGNGMQNCFGGRGWDFQLAEFRSAPKLAVCLSLTYHDGRTEEIEADESFVCAPSPIYYDDLRQGERYDANKEIPGWNLADFDDSAWTPAIPAVTPRGVSRVCEANPIVRVRELKPVSIKPGVTLTYARFPEIVDEGYLYDFGENVAGIPHLTVKGAPGQHISMIFGEYITPDGEFTVDNIRFVRPEYDGTPLYIQRDEYICCGRGVEEWEPKFTYHGYRYVLVMGITEEQAKEELLSYIVMNTELEERGGFSCSDETLNILQKMTRAATLANFYHFPTDCPHREKNGWTGDAAMSAEHTLLNLDPVNNYHEWMFHVRASMNDAGTIPGIIPTAGWGFAWGNGPAWDQVLAVIPYYTYRYRGDLAFAKDSLASLIRYVNYINSRRDANGLIAIGLGDWCAPKGVRSPLAFTDSVVSMSFCEKAALLFDVCGRPSEAAYCTSVAESLRKAVRTHLIDFETMTAKGENNATPGSQTSQAMAIFYNIFTKEEQPTAFRVLLKKIHEEDDHIDTGILGARVIFHVLSDFGEADLAYKLIAQKSEPSYGAFIDRGDTALPEDFGGKNDNANSRNHHFFGDISAWFIKSICGIQYNPTCRDLAHVNIAPHFVTALTHAEAFHICPEGRISVKWERTGEDTLTLTVEMPETMHGTLSFDRGWVCASCGKTETEAKSGTYLLKKA